MKHFKGLFLSALLSFAAMCTAAFPSSVSSAAKWIWYPEAFGEATNNATRYFRQTFDCQPGENASAMLYYMWDDSGSVYVNGVALDASRRIQNRPCHTYKIDGLLHAGKNVIAARIANAYGPAGLLLRLEVAEADGRLLNVVSDKNWKSAREVPASGEWLKLEFDDSAWVAVKEMGDTRATPWGPRYNLVDLLTREEQKIYRLEQEKGENLINELKNKLAAEPELTAKTVISANMPPRIDINGKSYPALLYDSPYPWNYHEEPTIAKIKNFRAGGIHLMVLGIESDIWRADGSIDFGEIEKRIYQALLLNPDAYLMLAINTTQSPEWWKSKNPDELVDYANGGIDRKATDPINRVPAPSMASKKWEHDFCDYITRIVTHLEKIPAGKRIFAYRVDNGVYREWHYFGMREGMPDTGKAMQGAFRDYLKRKYKNDGALRKAWRNKKVTFETAQIPEREARLHSLCGGMSLRDPVADAAVVDFLRCMQGVVRDHLLACNRAVKTACGYRKLCGNYYGYFFNMGFPAEGWQLETEALLRTREVDFQSAPDLYNYRRIQDAEFGRVPVETYALHGKMHIQEHDARTHLSKGESVFLIHAKNGEQSAGILSRGFAQSLIRNTACWYLDFSKDWYHDPAIYARFRMFAPILNERHANPSVAEVALVCDPESVYYHSLERRWRGTLSIDQNLQEITHAGVPFETILFNDIALDNVRDYKVYVFMNLFYVTEEKLALIEKLRRQGKTLVWLYAPGYLSQKGADAGGIEKVTGMRVKVSERACNGNIASLNGGDYKPDDDIKLAPSFRIEDKGCKPLGIRVEEGGKKETVFATCLIGSSRQYYAANGCLSSEMWRTLFRDSGVAIYENSGKPVVWIGGGYAAINGTAGHYTIKLPSPRKVTQLLPERGETSREPVTEINVELKENTVMRLYRLD